MRQISARCLLSTEPGRGNNRASVPLGTSARRRRCRPSEPEGNNRDSVSMTVYGYLRTSKQQQEGAAGMDPETQARSLEAANVAPSDAYRDLGLSGTTASTSRAGWRALQDRLRPGDTVVVVSSPASGTGGPRRSTRSGSSAARASASARWPRGNPRGRGTSKPTKTTRTASSANSCCRSPRGQPRRSSRRHASALGPDSTAPAPRGRRWADRGPVPRRCDSLRPSSGSTARPTGR